MKRAALAGFTAGVSFALALCAVLYAAGEISDRRWDVSR